MFHAEGLALWRALRQRAVRFTNLLCPMAAVCPAPLPPHSTEVSEAADQEAASSMTAAVEITPIEALPRRLGARAPVDVMGVVLALGQLGTVKRKADATELPRRDVTIGDTRWGWLGRVGGVRPLKRQVERWMQAWCSPSCKICNWGRGFTVRRETAMRVVMEFLTLELQ